MDWLIRVLLAAGLLVLPAIGFWRIGRRLVSLHERLEFTNEFGRHLKQLVESHGEDTEAYGWLVHRSSKMQGQMGATGVLATYRPPYANYMMSNVQIVINFIPELRRNLTDDVLSRIGFQYADMIQDALIRHHGRVSDQIDHYQKEARNPVAYFREGVRAILELPLGVLAALRILPASWIGALSGSTLFNFLVGLASLVTIITGVGAIILGWSEFWEFVSRLSP